MPMLVRAKVIAVAICILVLVISTFLYFTIRFRYIERDYIANLITITNEVVGSYQNYRKSTQEKNKAAAEDLSGYLKLIHGRYKDIALLAITDRNRSVRISSKNDRYIRSADLFEEILSDFTQERFNISKKKPYVIRYYDEKTGAGVEPLKFYIFLGKIGEYRLLVAYPYHFGKKIVVRTGLELFLMVMIVVLAAAFAYILHMKRYARTGKSESSAGEPALGSDSVPARGEESDHSPEPVPGGQANRILDLFRKIHLSFATDSISLYICRSSGTLVKTMELAGNAFIGDDSIRREVIDINNETGIELRKSTPLVLDQGRRIVLPLIYDNIFLGTVNIVRQNRVRGDEMREISSVLQGIQKQVHDSFFKS
jgi:hypothetical protein